MAKGDDNVQRKKNKVTRKKMSRKNDTATVSARIAAIIAAKKRRKSGKRSMCQVSHSLNPLRNSILGFDESINLYISGLERVFEIGNVQFERVIC